MKGDVPQEKITRLKENNDQTVFQKNDQVTQYGSAHTLPQQQQGVSCQRSILQSQLQETQL